jgi:hypothetical protein
MAIVVGARILNATGGTISDITGYRVHTFTSNATFVPTTSGPAEVLVVGGGGGANAGTIGGGASGGSVIYSKIVNLTGGQSYPIVIGTGGAQGSPGTATTAMSLTAQGGRVGSSGNGVANPLGTGSGAGLNGTGGTGANTTGFGYSGGNGSSTANGGGGGSGGTGTSASGGVNGVGGAGLPYSINGTTAFYGGGAGGGPAGAYNGTSSPTDKGLASNTTSSGNPGIVIVRYIR